MGSLNVSTGSPELALLMLVVEVEAYWKEKIL